MSPPCHQVGDITVTGHRVSAVVRTGALVSVVDASSRRTDVRVVNPTYRRDGHGVAVRHLPAPWGQRPANNVRVVACRVVEMLTVEIEGCRASHARLAARIEGLTDEVVREPSLLPAWSVGHVLTHLARNAEAMFHRIEATTRGEVIDQYVGGAEGRASEIESGAGRPANVLINDVISWSQRLDATFVSLPDDSWNRPVRSLRGDEHPVARLPFHRWWEVEVHLVDLAIGHTPADWPQELVDRALPRLVAGLANRADPRSLMAWTLGRGPAPGLESWV